VAKVFGYVRLSKDDDDKSKEEQNRSIINQIELITGHCQVNKKELIHIFDEGKSISGSDRHRKAFSEMIKRAIAGEVTEVVVKHRDRFCRDDAFFHDVLVDLRAYGVKVFSIDKGDFLDPDDLSDKVGSMMDSHYITEFRRKAGIMMRQKADKGLPFMSPPFGYRWSGKDGDRDRGWIQVPKEVIIVKKVFELLGQGYLKKNIGIELGISESKVHRIIKAKRIYEGFIAYRSQVKDSKGGVVKTDTIEYKGIHTPILTELTGSSKGV
jgi:DNA invertase Pin-like site-specific DNA recombinase